MNTPSYSESELRVKRLKRKILLRNTLSFLFCLIPSMSFAAWAFSVGGEMAKLFFAFIPVLLLMTILFYQIAGCRASNFLFDADFIIQSERFIKIKEDMRWEKIHQKRKEEGLKNADANNRLEADLRAVGLLKDAVGNGGSE